MNDEVINSLKKVIEEITKVEPILNQGLLRLDELRALTTIARREYEVASNHDSIQYRKYDKTRRSRTRWRPVRRSGYAESDDGSELLELKQEIAELLHMSGVKVETKEIFLPPGQPFLGRTAIRNILSRAAVSIDIKDDYLFSSNQHTKNLELLQILSPYLESSLKLRVRLLGSSQNLPRPVLSDVAAFMKQFPNAELKGYSHSEDGSKQTHDRFIIIDNKEVFTSGASLKDLGISQSAISQVKDETTTRQYTKVFDQWWVQASPYTGL
ncbi:hypothetical protein HY380_00075 [Candidatus Saccharibacteria bacterium]|nr:hypothetical protein [Candidatus Saccharibacteria bacterium]